MASAIQFRLKRNEISPDIRHKLARVENRRPVLEAMGLQLVSLTRRAFTDSSLRPSTWPPRKKPVSWQILRKSGTLWKSIRVTDTTNNSVTVGSDRPYAAVHQLGSSKSTGRGGGIPARPFFPVLDGKLTAIAHKKIDEIALAKIATMLK
jgi:phage gpG-like protein